jgi:two-component system chemotaxis sensor kinase CheA
VETLDSITGNREEESPEEVLEALRETFRDEAYELLGEIEAALLNLENDPDDRELLGRVFRALHTLKGSGSICEFKELSAFTHEVETCLDMARKGQAVISKEFIDFTLLCRDQIKAMLDEHYEGRPADRNACQVIVASFNKFLREQSNSSATPSPCSSQPETTVCRTLSSQKAAPGKTAYRIRFRPRHDLRSEGLVIATLLEGLRLLGYCEVASEGQDPDNQGRCWDIILVTERGRQAIEEAFLPVKDAGELNVEVIDEEAKADSDTSYKKIGEILVERGDLAPEEIEKVLAEQKKLGELLVESGHVAPGTVKSALAEQQLVRELRTERLKAEESASIRVAAGKLDGMVDLVGELATVQANLSRTASSHGIAEFRFLAEQVERLTAELYDKTLSIRMIPIKTVFGKLKRLVHDLSRNVGKEIEFVTSGGETEIDKTVMECLSDPLVHLIRNCIDHGIEPAETRAAAGKPRRGTVSLSAAHSGAHVLIQVRDDGSGLDRDAIRAKGLEKGRFHPDANPTDKELFQLIFMPGFSTAHSVTEISGRGVGMDVVSKAIDALHGSVEIDSKQGSGTVVTLRLPLTLAIINGLLVEIENESFVLPLTFVRECVELTEEDRKNAHGRHIADVRGEIIPYIHLRECFFLGGDPPHIEQIVITEVNGSRIGLVVDKVIGDHQTVIKNLGEFYRDTEGVSGATILGTGTIALILDVPELARMAEREEAKLRRVG